MMVGNRVGNGVGNSVGDEVGNEVDFRVGNRVKMRREKRSKLTLSGIGLSYASQGNNQPQAPTIMPCISLPG